MPASDVPAALLGESSRNDLGVLPFASHAWPRSKANCKLKLDACTGMCRSHCLAKSLCSTRHFDSWQPKRGHSSPFPMRPLHEPMVLHVTLEFAASNKQASRFPQDRLTEFGTFFGRHSERSMAVFWIMAATAAAQGLGDGAVAGPEGRALRGACTPSYTVMPASKWVQHGKWVQSEAKHGGGCEVLGIDWLRQQIDRMRCQLWCTLAL